MGNDVRIKFLLKIKRIFLSLCGREISHNHIIFLYLIISTWGINIPSSIQQLIKGKDANLQIKLLDSLALQFGTKDFALSTALSKLGLSIAKQNNFHSSTVKTYLTLCRTYRSKAHYDTALAYIDSANALAFANNLHDKYGVIFDFEGLVYMRLGDYTKATEKFYACVKYSEQEKDSVTLRKAFDHLGSVNFYRHDFKSAIKFYKNALSYTSASKNIYAFTSTLDNIGLAFSNLNIYDSALFYQKQAVSVFEKLKDSTLLAECYGNIGATYFHLEKFNDAERFFMKAFIIHRILQSDYGIQLANLNLGKLYLKKTIQKKRYHT
jgi:tetratricopeptide (TPR) repeat protein